MTNPYIMNNSDYSYDYRQLAPQQKKSSTLSAVMKMSTLGAVSGGAIGYYKYRYPVNKNGQVADSFSKKVFDKYIDKNVSTSAKKVFKHANNIVQKIDKAKSPDAVKTLINSNKAAFDSKLTGINIDNMLCTINTGNLKSKKDSIKKLLKSCEEFNLKIISDSIKLCWNKEKHNFAKPEEMDNKLFKAIKTTTSNHQWKKAAKYGGVAAGIMGAITLGYKIITSRQQIPNQQMLLK